MLYAAAVSPDGKTLAVSGSGYESFVCPVFVLDLQEGSIRQVLRGHGNVVNCLSFSPDGSRLASGSSDMTARVWDLNTGDCTQHLKGHAKQIWGIAFAPDGGRLATASHDKTCIIWDLPREQSQHVLRGHGAEVQAVAWSKDGNRLATGGRDQTIRLWDEEGKAIHIFESLRGNIHSLKFIKSDREILFTTSFVGVPMGEAYAACLDLYTTGKVRTRLVHHNTCYGADISPDGSQIVSTGGFEHEIYLWLSSDAKVMTKMAGKSKAIWAVAWDSSGRIAWGHSPKGSTRLANMPLEYSFSLEKLGFDIAPDSSFAGRTLADGAATLSFEGPASVHYRRDGSSLAFEKPANPAETVRCATLLADNLAAVGGDFGVYLHDVTTGKRRHTLLGHTGIITSVAHSADKRYLASASSDQTLRIWSLHAGDTLLSLFFAGDDWIAWTPEGYYAASPGGEQLMGWQVNNGLGKMASFYPASRFRKTLYRPDVIKLLLKAGSVECVRDGSRQGAVARQTEPDNGETRQCALVSTIEALNRSSSDSASSSSSGSSSGGSSSSSSLIQWPRNHLQSISIAKFNTTW